MTRLLDGMAVLGAVLVLAILGAVGWAYVRDACRRRRARVDADYRRKLPWVCFDCTRRFSTPAEYLSHRESVHRRRGVKA